MSEIKVLTRGPNSSLCCYLVSIPPIEASSSSNLMAKSTIVEIRIFRVT